jgi:hypothetical protein
MNAILIQVSFRLEHIMEKWIKHSKNASTFVIMILHVSQLSIVQMVLYARALENAPSRQIIHQLVQISINGLYM